METFQTRLFKHNLQRIYSTIGSDGKINHMPGLCGEFFGFTQLYDWVVETNQVDLNISEEDKKILWTAAKKSASDWGKRNNCKDKKWISGLAKNYYKSELIYKYLADRYNQTGKKMEIVWD